MDELLPKVVMGISWDKLFTIESNTVVENSEKDNS